MIKTRSCKTSSSFCYAALLTCALVLHALTARAISDEIQVYTDELTKRGEVGMELHINTTPRGRKTPDYSGDSPPQHGWRITPEISTGLAKDWDIGLYLPTVLEANGTFSLAGAKLRLKWMALHGDDDAKGWYAGANLELSSVNKRYSESRYGSELRMITGYRAKEWHIAVNPILIWDLSKGHRAGGPGFDLATKAVHDVVDGIAMGLEYYAGWGKLAHTLPGAQQDHTLYAVMDYERKPVPFNFGIGKGLNRATDRWTIKAVLDVPLK